MSKIKSAALMAAISTFANVDAANALVPAVDGEKKRDWIIEFRSGSFFTTLEAEHGGSRADAAGFDTKEAAEIFADLHRWIWFNGGMVIER